MWGWAEVWRNGDFLSAGFPTHVGVFLAVFFSFFVLWRFPHACGGVPLAKKIFDMAPFSPRMWGCSGKNEITCHVARVFPTHVGVLRSGIHKRVPMLVSPRCGGVASTSSATGR